MARDREFQVIADNLKKAGWSLGYVSAVVCKGRTIWIVDAHRDDGKRFVVRAEEKLTAFVEVEATIRTHSSGRTLRINSVGDFFLKNQGLSPIGSRAASITVLASNREQNRDLLAMCSPASCKDQIKTNAAEKKTRWRFCKLSCSLLPRRLHFRLSSNR